MTMCSRRATWLLVVMMVGACARKMPASSSAPSTEAAAGADFAVDDGVEEQASLDAWEDELTDLEAQLRASGVTLGDHAALAEGAVARDLEQEHAQAFADDDAVARCQRICDLAEATCGLQDRICALADEHDGEPRYAAACSRADDDCRAASEACRACGA